MGDILKPNTSESLVEQARRRRIPTIGNAGYPSPEPALPVPTAPVVEQQQPTAPPVPEEAAAPVVEQPVSPSLQEQPEPSVPQEQPVSPS